MNIIGISLLIAIWTVIAAAIASLVAEFVSIERSLRRRRRTRKDRNTQFIYRDYCIGCRTEIPTESGHICEDCGGVK
jgi:hypothetical protein